ncbi:MAG: GTPase HflX [Clostridia bacterium]|nr:GTPase HflX [Clostridia bacterium]
MAENLIQRAILVGISKSNEQLNSCKISLRELAELLDTAGGEVAGELIQIKSSYDAATCIGSGKVQELSELCNNEKANLVVFDNELSPSQIRNIEEKLDGDVRVIDRSMLILDIFALHAKTGEGKLQVELAQLKYTAPRLIGKGAELSRQGGKIGTRGPGESQLESDKRHLKRRIDALEAELEQMVRTRMTMRAARDRSGLPKIAIVGYTNAGKSTLLNTLTDAGVLSENKLFATLDPTTRRLTLADGEDVLLTDTVGFIRNLPHHLIKAFRSTLDEAAYSDIILIIADITDPECSEHLKITQELLETLGAGDKPTVIAYNKCDALETPFIPNTDNSVAISARTGEGIDSLLQRLLFIIRNSKRRLTLLFPYDAQSELNSLYAVAKVEDVNYTDTGAEVVAILDKKTEGKYKIYIKNDK